jgi:ATP-binding cassette subfamily B (MDR/TAP) protein 1
MVNEKNGEHTASGLVYTKNAEVDGASAEEPESEMAGGKVAPNNGKPENDEKGKKKPRVPVGQLYRYATTGDKLLMVFGSLCAMAVGCVFPLFTIIFGKVLDVLNDPATSSDKGKQAESIRSLCVYFVIIAIVSGICCFFEYFVPVRVTERVLERVRHEYMRSLLRQDMGWYDTNRGGEATARVAEATLQMSAGMEKLCSLLKTICTLLCGIIIGFTTSWKLTLVIMGCAPFFAIALTVLIISITRGEAQSQEAYARAGDVASEVYANVRTVAAYSGEKHEVQRYDRFLADAEKAGSRKGAALGFSVGLMLFSFYAMYGVSTYAGAEFIVQSRNDDPECAINYGKEGCFTGGKVVQTFVAVLLGALSFGNVGPIFGALAAAQTAAAELYELIDRVPPIDIEDPKGHAAPITGKVLSAPRPPQPPPQSLLSRTAADAPPGRAADRVQELHLRLPVAAGVGGPPQLQPDHRAGPDGGAGGAIGQRQEHHHRPAGALLRPARGRGPD